MRKETPQFRAQIWQRPLRARVPKLKAISCSLRVYVAISFDYLISSNFSFNYTLIMLIKDCQYFRSSYYCFVIVSISNLKTRSNKSLVSARTLFFSFGRDVLHCFGILPKNDIRYSKVPPLNLFHKNSLIGFLR